MHTVSIGVLNETNVHPREVYKIAILSNAASIIVGHNHPAGTLTPSKADIETTKHLQEAGALLGIKLLDHIIVTDSNFYSLAEGGYIY